ncbi:MAG TPA: hypothetical protein VEM40_04305 [Nitrospirota bacterium]|nr:hypothetical protein [Nitrospirota bacterium]
MKLLYRQSCMMLGFALVLAACTDEKNPAQQYGNSMVQTYKNVQKIEKKVDLQQAQKSVQEFYAANGRYPADLKELSGFSGLPLDAEQYDYNASSGVLTSKQ